MTLSNTASEIENLLSQMFRLVDEVSVESKYPIDFLGVDVQPGDIRYYDQNLRQMFICNADIKICGLVNISQGTPVGGQPITHLSLVKCPQGQPGDVKTLNLQGTSLPPDFRQELEEFLISLTPA